MAVIELGQEVKAARQRLYAVHPHEPSEPQETIADQMDGGDTCRQAKALFDQQGHPTGVAHRPD